MDRFFDQMNKEGKSLELADLHLTGVTTMFLASKYEDVLPLLMRTVFNKIGHKKIPVDTIRAKETDILMALGFRVGAAPTSLEFLERYIEDVLGSHPDKDFIHLMAIYLAKMATHHENLCTKKSSLLGASSIYVALKICEQMRQTQILTKEISNNLL
jgi:hypothetical protein